MSSSVVHNTADVQQSRISLDLAIGFYAKGFKIIHSALFEDNKKQAKINNAEFHFFSFISQLVWTVVFWATLIIPFTNFDFSFKKEYVFKESFDNNLNGWDLHDDNDSYVKLRDGKLVIHLKDNPNNDYGWTKGKCRYSLYDCPSKYTIEMKCEFIHTTGHF